MLQMNTNVRVALCGAMVLLGAGVSVDAAVITGNTADNEVNENSTVGNSAGTGARVGSSGTNDAATNGRNGVFVFQLPTAAELGSNTTFTDASLSLTLLGNAPDGNGGYTLDLYGLGRRNSTTVLGTDYFEGGLDTTDATPLGDNFVTTSTTFGARTLSSAALNDYLTAQYAGGAGAGQFVFFRLNPDVATDFRAEARIGYQFATADNATVADRPTLTYTAVPEPASLALLALGGALMLGRRKA